MTRDDVPDADALVAALRRGEPEPLAALVSRNRERLRRMIEFRS